MSWDYAGLLTSLASLTRDRTGLPVLRCYWYEATVESRRTSEHDALADLPGLKLRLGKMRPGRREGVETEIHRDLTTLARNGAVQDAVILSAEEDLAPVVAEVQDLGIRVVLIHIAVDGNWTISRPLRQECDDVIEISEAQLRPFVELISAAEPAQRHGQYASSYGSVNLPVGQSQTAGGHSQPAAPRLSGGFPPSRSPLRPRYTPLPWRGGMSVLASRPERPAQQRMLGRARCLVRARCRAALTLLVPAVRRARKRRGIARTGQGGPGRPHQQDRPC